MAGVVGAAAAAAVVVEESLLAHVDGPDGSLCRYSESVSCLG